MKNITKIALFLLAFLVVAVSCKKEEPKYKITADREAVTDVPANTPGVEVIVVTTDAPYWILQTPDWVTAAARRESGSAAISLSSSRP